MAEWIPPELKKFPIDVNADNKVFTLQFIREAIIWNKTQVKPADAPKEWLELFDPKWKGKVDMSPPWRSLAIQHVLTWWEDRRV